MGFQKVQCWIFSKKEQGLNEKIMCLLLKTNASRGAFWQPVTGSVEPGEGYFEAACREPIEETGFHFTTPPLDVGFEFEYTSQFGITKERVFALVVDQPLTPTLDPKEHQDFLWTEIEKSSSLLKYSSNREGLKKSFEKLFGLSARKAVLD